MKFCVASIEDGIASLEASDRTVTRIPVSDLPENVREGDWLIKDSDGALVPDPEETRRRRARNRDLFNSLLEP